VGPSATWFLNLEKEFELKTKLKTTKLKTTKLKTKNYKTKN
jgi:hypothetical protein